MDSETGKIGASPGDRPAVERARELAVLNSIAEALNSSANVQQALRQTLALVADLLGLQTGWVWLLNPEDQQFYLAAAQNLPPFLQEPLRMSGRRCLCTELFRKGELQPTNVGVLSCSRLSEAFTAQVPEETLGLRFHASIPLFFKDRPLGIINITGPSERKLTTDELRLLETIAYQMGIAVERARLAEESTRLARAEERTRIAREIHDTLAQGLTAIGLDLEGAMRHLENSPERARERLERALVTTQYSLEEARRSMLDLRAGPPDGRSLAKALEALGRTFTSGTGLPVHVRHNSSKPVPLRIEAGLYRIAQEALANVRKHANATRVEIEFRTTSQDVRLSIYDDGVGFGPSSKTNGGQSLLGHARAGEIAGWPPPPVEPAGSGHRSQCAGPAPAGGCGMIRIVVVDDHPIVRQGIVATLEDEEDFEVVGTAGSAEEALELVGRLGPEVVLLDLELPGMGGLEAIPQLI